MHGNRMWRLGLKEMSMSTCSAVHAIIQLLYGMICLV